MRNVFLACSIGLLLLGSAMAKDDSLGVTTTLTTGLNGSYYFRGAKLATNGLASDATVAYAISPRLSAKVYYWNYLRTGAPRTDALENDYDLSLTWTPPIAKDLMSFTLGTVYYDELRAAMGADTAEAYAGVTFNVPWSPSLFGYYQFKKVPGAKSVGSYLRFSVSNSYALGQAGWTGTITGWAGFDTNRLAKGAFQDAGLRTALAYELSPGLTVGPAIDWIIPGPKLHKLRTGFVTPVPSLGFAWSRSF